VEGDRIRVQGISQLPSNLLAKLRDYKPNLLTYLQSSQRILDDAGVMASYATTDAEAVPLLAQVLADAVAGGPIGLDIETYVPSEVTPPPVLKLTRHGASVSKPKDDKTGLDPHIAQVRLLQIYGGGGLCAVLDMQTVSWKTLTRLWSRQLVIHNSQFELGFFQAQKIRPEFVECTMQAAGLMLGVHRRGLAKVAGEYLGWRMPKDLQTSDWGAPKLSNDQLAYAALDAVAALLIWRKLERALKSASRWDAYILQRDSVAGAVEMAWCGIGIDVAELDLRIADWSSELARARSAWEHETGTPPPSKPSEIREWLEGALSEAELAEWPKTKKTDKLSTANSDLERAGHLPALRPLLLIKRMEKLLSSFGVSLKAQVHPLTGRIHASYNVAGTKSGRWSCSAPNLQQVPGERLAPGFRGIFKAPEGRVLIGADYSQMELRAAAEVSGDMALRKIYKDGLDLHQLTAAAMASIDPSEVTKEQRSRAKPVNFGSIYGMGPNGLAAAAWNGYRVEMTTGEARSALQAFFRNYPTLARWMRQHADRCRSLRRITIGAGRVLENAWEPSGIRYTQCCNLPVQGVCADVMMRAVSGVHRRLHTEGLDAIMVAQIHDELILEADRQDADTVSTILKAEMTKAFNGTFPDAPIGGLVEVHVGASWGKLK
jgi:DNA polymerase-1